MKKRQKSFFLSRDNYNAQNFVYYSKFLCFSQKGAEFPHMKREQDQDLFLTHEVASSYCNQAYRFSCCASSSSPPSSTPPKSFTCSFLALFSRCRRPSPVLSPSTSTSTWIGCSSCGGGRASRWGSPGCGRGAESGCGSGSCFGCGSGRRRRQSPSPPSHGCRRSRPKREKLSN